MDEKCPIIDSEDEELLAPPPKKKPRIDIGDEPSEDDKLPKLENWAVVNSPPDDPYKDPYTFGTAILRGDVYGHPLKEDGHRIWTSPLLYQKKDLARTCSRWYRLGTPDEGYVAYMTKEGKEVKSVEGTTANSHMKFEVNEEGHFKGTYNIYR